MNQKSDFYCMGLKSKGKVLDPGCIAAKTPQKIPPIVSEL